MEKEKRNFRSELVSMTLAAMFMAIGLVLPFLTGQIKTIGRMLLPMHFPVMLCGLICGWHYGALVGFTLPILRSVIFTMPVFYPTALAMAFELMTYGLVISLCYSVLPKRTVHLYASLIIAMVAGRVVWGGVTAILLGATGSALTWKVFISGSLLNAFPGIILQILIIPALMMLLKKMRLLK